MKVFTTISIVIVITLNSCSSTHNSTGSGNTESSYYYNAGVSDQYLKLKTHKLADWKYFDDYDKYSSSITTPAPLYHLGIVPFGIYGGVMRIPIFYYNPDDYYRDVTLNALDLYNNPSNYLLRYYSWNEYYNPYFYTAIPNSLDLAFNTSVNIYPTDQYDRPSGNSVNNGITSLYSGQIRNVNDIRNILNYTKKINDNSSSASLKNNQLRTNKNNSFSNTNKPENNSRNADNNNRSQTEPVRNFTALANNNVVVAPTAYVNPGSGMSAPAPVGKIR